MRTLSQWLEEHPLLPEYSAACVPLSHSSGDAAVDYRFCKLLDSTDWDAPVTPKLDAELSRYLLIQNEFSWAALNLSDCTSTWFENLLKLFEDDQKAFIESLGLFFTEYILGTCDLRCSYIFSDRDQSPLSGIPLQQFAGRFDGFSLDSESLIDRCSLVEKAMSHIVPPWQLRSDIYAVRDIIRQSWRLDVFVRCFGEIEPKLQLLQDAFVTFFGDLDHFFFSESDKMDMLLGETVKIMTCLFPALYESTAEPHDSTSSTPLEQMSLMTVDLTEVIFDIIKPLLRLAAPRQVMKSMIAAEFICETLNPYYSESRAALLALERVRGLTENANGPFEGPLTGNKLPSCLQSGRSSRGDTSMFFDEDDPNPSSRSMGEVDVDLIDGILAECLDFLKSYDLQDCLCYRFAFVLACLVTLPEDVIRAFESHLSDIADASVCHCMNFLFHNIPNLSFPQCFCEILEKLAENKKRRLVLEYRPGDDTFCSLFANCFEVKAGSRPDIPHSVSVLRLWSDSAIEVDEILYWAHQATSGVLVVDSGDWVKSIDDNPSCLLLHFPHSKSPKNLPMSPGPQDHIKYSAALTIAKRISDISTLPELIFSIDDELTKQFSDVMNVNLQRE